MLRLETLGGLALRTEAGVGVSTQRRRLALMALLAGAGDRGVSRDKLQAYLWPESPGGSSRHSLEQLLYELRRQLGDAVLLDTDPLRLNPDVIASDLATFEDVLARGADAEAVAAYQGPFLDGFHLGDAAEFERWVEGERARLAAAYGAALERLAQRATQQGDHRAAVEVWRKLAALDPLSSRSALGLLRALVAAGDRPEALRYARTYEALVRDELDTSPDPALQTFVRQLRASPDMGGSPGSAGAHPPDQPAEATAQQSRSEEKAAAGVGSGTLDAPRILPSFRRLVVGLAAVAGAVIAVTWMTQRISGSSPAPALDPNSLLVVPFRVANTDTALTYLRDGMVDLLAARFTGEGGLLAVDPRMTASAWSRILPAERAVATAEAFRVARAVGAGQILLGEVVRTAPTRIQLSGTVLALPEGALRRRATVEGAGDSLLALVDGLAARFLALHAGEREPRLSALASAKLPALRAFLDGRAAYRRGADQAAVSQFSRALQLDSTFAIAAVELASSMGWLFRWTTRQDSAVSPGVRLGSGLRLTGDESLWSRAIDVAWRERRRLGESDLAYLRAMRGDHYPGVSSARQVVTEWDRAVREAPDRADAWNRLGHALLQQGLALGLSDVHTRAAALFRRALEIDPGYVSPLVGLIEIAAYARDTAQLQRLGARYLNRDSTSENADYVRWRVATVIGDRAALQSLRQRMDSLDTQTLDRIQWASQTDGIAMEDADRAMTALVRRAGERKERWISLWTANILALNGGRPGMSLQLTQSKLQVEPDSGLFRWYRILHALYWDADSAAGAEAAAALERHAAAALAAGQVRSDPRDAYRELALVEQWRLWHGDTSRAERTIRLLRRSAVEDADPARGEQAMLLDAIRSGILRRPDALALLGRIDSITLRGCCNTPHYFGIVAGRLRERAGDRAGALRAFRRGRWLYPPEYLSTYLREEGRLAALTADTAGAIAAYRHYLTLRSNPEPSRQPAADSVRAELARLGVRR